MQPLVDEDELQGAGLVAFIGIENFERQRIKPGHSIARRHTVLNLNAPCGVPGGQLIFDVRGCLVAPKSPEQGYALVGRLCWWRHHLRRRL